jgi:alpha-L-fucosidase
MNFNKSLTIKLLVLTFFIVSNIAAGQVNVNNRAQWFVNDRFGMFIHFGLYSGAEGVWKGEKLRNDNDYAEWIQYRNRISKEEYLTLTENFNWDEIDPENWVILAKNAGMKYVTITAKHHDGFALWDSKASDYDVAGYTNPKRDIIRELAAACKKHGLKLGLYYSHWVDWEHPYGWDHTKEISGISPSDFNKYWQEKVIPQMTELLSNYGPVGMIWFDMWIHHSQTIVTKEQLLQLKKLIRDLQPECLINSRLGLSVEEDNDVDFQELGDNEFGSTKKDFPWQSPATVAHSWGYNRLDNDYKSTTSLLQSLIRNVSLNGNLLLNIGPRSDGTVPYEIEKRLLEMGEWLRVNGESVYGSSASDLPGGMNDWGVITQKENPTGCKLFLHIFSIPSNRKLKITGIKSIPVTAYMLDDKNRTPLTFVHDEIITDIELPKVFTGKLIPVVVLEYSSSPECIIDLAAQNIEGGYSLTPQNAVSYAGQIDLVPKSRGGTVPNYLSVKSPATLRWKIYVDNPGLKTIYASYSYQGKSLKNQIHVKIAENELKHEITNTGKTVGEPKSDWVIDNFRSSLLGSVDFNEKGYYELEISITPLKSEEVKFQWLWLK